MNKYIEEYENMSLYDFADELDEPLFTIKQNLTQAIYLHYAKERDENFKLQQENKEQEEYITYWQKEMDKRQDKIDKAIEYLVNPPKKIWEGHSIDEVIKILKDSDVDVR